MSEDISAILPLNKTNNDFTRFSTSTMKVTDFTKEDPLNISKDKLNRSRKMKFHTGEIISKSEQQTR
jgi:hypothetical protein